MESMPPTIHDLQAAVPDDAESTRTTIRPEAELAANFAGLTRRLAQQYPIDKGVLVLRDEEGSELSAISTWHDGVVRDGLRLNLPARESLFEKVAEDGRVYTEDFCDSFSGNFFERKLLLDNASRCFVVQPLISEGRVKGLLGYSSRRPSAFAMFADGALDDIAERFGEVIESAQNRY